jgi:hypothetical protein
LEDIKVEQAMIVQDFIIYTTPLWFEKGNFVQFIAARSKLWWWN